MTPKGRQPVAFGNLCLAGFTAAEGAAFRQQFRTRGAVNGAVHTAAAQQGTVGRVDDGVHLHFGDIISDNFEGHEDSLSFLGSL